MIAESTINDLPAAGTPRFTTLTAHRLWLIDNARALFDFFQRPSFNPAGGFFSLDENARPLSPKPGHKGANRGVHDTSRMVHSFAIAHLLGTPGADRIVDHGMAFLWERTRDGENGGYFWGVDDEKPTDPTKQAYGHAFVLLAASSAMCVGHPDAPRLIADVTQVIEDRFWDKAAGATTEEYNPDWSPMGSLSRPELQHASHRSLDGGLRGDGRAWLSRQGGKHCVIDHRPPRPQRGLAGRRTFHRELGRRPRRIGEIRCSARAARRPAMRSNGAACWSSSGSLGAAGRHG